MSTRTTSSRSPARRRRAALALGLAGLLDAGAAGAGGDYEQARMKAGGSARDLAVSHDVEALLTAREREVAARRKTGIALIEVYLREHPPGPETPEVLFQLAELRWEESRAAFLGAMAAHNAALEACQKEAEEAQRRAAQAAQAAQAAEARRAGAKPEPRPEVREARVQAPLRGERCKPRPQPRLELGSSQVIYRRLIGEYPTFRKIDAVRYLYGFSLRSEGKAQEALQQFKAILNDHPTSRFRPDAWMAVAEARFYDDGEYKAALEGYDQVLKYPDSPLYDLALFKTAWCFWKLGDADKAARRFKEVLDLGSGKEGTAAAARADQLTKEGRKRLEELKGEALDYLVQIFTEDERKGPKDAFEFLSSIGGAAYSRKVIDKLASTFYAQARYERAIESERFLIELDPSDEACPDRQKRIVDAYREMDENKQAVKELRRLADAYGPGSDWAKKQEDPKVVEHARLLASKELRDVAKQLHADAQRTEQLQKRVDPDRFARAAEAYAYYLSKFGGDQDAAEVHYLLGDIYFFKLKKNEEAGDEYLAVGRSKPVGKLHREALLNAIGAFERLRKEKAAGKQLLPSDKKMGEAIDLYATLFPKDPEIANVLLKNGELFYEHGEYDEAVKRFGKIVEAFPQSPVAAAAGDKILESLNKAKDYDNIEGWARRLLKVPAFQAKADQDRLGKLVVEAGMKAGEQKAEQDPLRAAEIYLRVAKEFPASSLAPQALMNAATTQTRGGKPEEAVETYAKVIDKYAASPLAPQAAWAAARLYEQSALWDQAARNYQVLAERWPKDGKAADALYNAGLLKERLGDTKGAIAAYGEYARRWKSREDSREVAFRVGVVLSEAGQKDAAAKAFLDFAKEHPGGAQAIEALMRAGEALVGLGQHKRAQEPLERAVSLYRKGSGETRGLPGPAAHARYLLGEIQFHEFERVQLATDAKRLKRTLDEKSGHLEKARAAYIDAVTFSDPEWATAALYRIGEGYEQFAKALRGAPVPAQLSEEEKQVYRDELEKVVVVVEEKAIDAYKNGYQKALQLGVYNDFTQRLRQALGRLSDQEFPPEPEARARPETAEPRAELPFLGSVIR